MGIERVGDWLAWKKAHLEHRFGKWDRLAGKARGEGMRADGLTAPGIGEDTDQNQSATSIPTTKTRPNGSFYCPP